jgi:putative phosphoribosyl transferase
MKTSEINILVEGINLRGNLTIPPNAKSFVVFSHGSGSSRFSTRNRLVAETLNKNNIATLLTDLLTLQEDNIYANRFNIDLITERLVSVINYCTQLPDLKNLPLGCFGASTGAASALRAAARLTNIIKAVVSRGGRPDMAGSALVDVKAPTLLIVGSLDTDVIILNEQAYSRLTCEKEIKIVKGATHLFEEPGKLDEVAELAVDWFNKHLVTNTKFATV